MMLAGYTQVDLEIDCLRCLGSGVVHIPGPIFRGDKGNLFSDSVFRAQVCPLCKGTKSACYTHND